MFDSWAMQGRSYNQRTSDALMAGNVIISREAFMATDTLITTDAVLNRYALVRGDVITSGSFKSGALL